MRLRRPGDGEPRYQTGKDGLSSTSQSNIEVEVRSGEGKGHSPSWFEVLQLLGSRRNGKIKDVFLGGTTKKKKKTKLRRGAGA